MWFTDTVDSVELGIVNRSGILRRDNLFEREVEDVRGHCVGSFHLRPSQSFLLPHGHLVFLDQEVRVLEDQRRPIYLTRLEVSQQRLLHVQSTKDCWKSHRNEKV